MNNASFDFRAESGITLIKGDTDRDKLKDLIYKLGDLYPDARYLIITYNEDGSPIRLYYRIHNHSIELYQTGETLMAMMAMVQNLCTNEYDPDIDEVKITVKQEAVMSNIMTGNYAIEWTVSINYDFFGNESCIDDMQDSIIEWFENRKRI